MGANTQSPCTTEILLNQVKVSFKLDTGAEVTAISDDTYRQLGLPKLDKPSKVLYGPAKRTFDVVGQFTATLEHERSNSQQVVFVVKGLRNNLLGLPAIIALQLLYRAASVHTAEILKQFQKSSLALVTLVRNTRSS